MTESSSTITLKYVNAAVIDSRRVLFLHFKVLQPSLPDGDASTSRYMVTIHQRKAAHG